MQKRNKPSYEDLVEIIERYDNIRKDLTHALNERYKIHIGESMGENPTLSNNKELKELEQFIITHISNEWTHSDENPYHELELYNHYLANPYVKSPDLPNDYEPPF